jgi:hypothetical protein
MAVIMRLVPSTFTSNIARQSSGSPCSTVAEPNAPPALLMSACTGPSAATSSRTRSTSA